MFSLIKTQPAMRTGNALLQFASSSPMALTLSPLTGIYRHSIHRHHVTFPNRSTNSYNRNFLSPVNLRRSYPASASNSCCCGAGTPGRQPPPESDPPNGNDPSLSEGLTTTFARLQDTVQIFFAVLFWMSLFFWSSVWNGRNNN